MVHSQFEGKRREPPRDEAMSSIHTELFSRLDFSLAQLWAEAKTGKLWERITSRGFDRDLYRLVMVQIFHYTRHNSINQAVAALRADPDDVDLLRFVYGHAREELGHDRMVINDLRSIGLVEDEGTMRDAVLPATDALINYLFGVALREGPVARLGYSYWAESVYQQIAPLLRNARESLGLADRNMTFFTAHATIDSKHAEQVRAMLRRVVTTKKRAEAVHRVAVTSLWLTIQILEQSAVAAATVDGKRS